MLNYRQLQANSHATHAVAHDYGVFDAQGAYLGTVTKGDDGWIAVTAQGKCPGDQYESRDKAGEALARVTQG